VIKKLLFIGFVFVNGLFGMEQHIKLIQETKIEISLAHNKDEKKKLYTLLTKLMVQKKDLKLKELEERCRSLSLYQILGAHKDSEKSKVWAYKIPDKKNRWIIDAIAFDGSGDHIVWNGRYERSKKGANIGLAKLFKIDKEKKDVDCDSVGLTTECCDSVFTIFNNKTFYFHEKGSLEFAFFANGMQSNEEYGLARWCRLSHDIKNYSISSRYYNVGVGEGCVSAGEFYPHRDVLAFARGSSLLFCKKSDENSGFSILSIKTGYEAIFDMQFSPDGCQVGVVHALEDGSGISLYKTLSTKVDHLDVSNNVDIKEFYISPHGKSYAVVLSSQKERTVTVRLYDAQKLQLKSECSVSGILAHSEERKKKSYFSQDGEWFIVPVVDEGKLKTTMIDANSWKVSQVILHGKAENHRSFKIVGNYGSLVRDAVKKVFIFDIRNSDKIDEIDVKNIPKFALIGPKGYIVTASEEGRQPNVEMHKYN